MWVAIGTGLQIIYAIIQWWFKLNNDQKEKAKELLKGVPNAKDAKSIVAMFDAIDNR